MKIQCNKCAREVEPVLESFNSQFEVNEKIYRYRAYRGYCPECNSLIEETPCQDTISRDKAYRKAEGIITTSQINEILEKYEINDENLSNALGWENNKIENYLLGDIPSAKDSEMLFSMLEDEKYARLILS